MEYMIDYDLLRYWEEEEDESMKEWARTFYLFADLFEGLEARLNEIGIEVDNYYFKESRRSLSKYIYIYTEEDYFKIRVSDHDNYSTNSQIILGFEDNTEETIDMIIKIARNYFATDGK